MPVIQVSVEIEPNRLEAYKLALRELPSRTDEHWKAHLAYQVQDAIDKTITEAKRYREWRGHPPIHQLRQFLELLNELRCQAQSEQPDNILNEQITELYTRYESMLNTGGRMHP